MLRTFDSSGGGYGDPLMRDPRRGLRDVLEGWEAAQRAMAIYDVVPTGSVDGESLLVDVEAAGARRSVLQMNS